MPDEIRIAKNAWARTVNLKMHLKVSGCDEVIIRTDTERFMAVIVDALNKMKIQGEHRWKIILEDETIKNLEEAIRLLEKVKEDRAIKRNNFEI